MRYHGTEALHSASTHERLMYFRRSPQRAWRRSGDEQIIADMSFGDISNAERHLFYDAKRYRRASKRRHGTAYRWPKASPRHDALCAGISSGIPTKPRPMLLWHCARNRQAFCTAILRSRPDALKPASSRRLPSVIIGSDAMRRGKSRGIS